ncbi:MAG: hypothetical protein Q9188_003852 [Gyalolechia gomerana]
MHDDVAPPAHRQQQQHQILKANTPLDSGNHSIGNLNSDFELLEPQATGWEPFDLTMLGSDNVSTTDATHGVSNGSMDSLMKTTPPSTITRGISFGEQPDVGEQSWQFPTDLGVDIVDESSVAAANVDDPSAIFSPTQSSLTSLISTPIFNEFIEPPEHSGMGDQDQVKQLQRAFGNSSWRPHNIQLGALGSPGSKDTKYSFHNSREQSCPCVLEALNLLKTLQSEEYRTDSDTIDHILKLSKQAISKFSELITCLTFMKTSRFTLLIINLCRLVTSSFEKNLDSLKVQKQKLGKIQWSGKKLDDLNVGNKLGLNTERLKTVLSNFTFSAPS